jgi:hypothetical protein
MADREAYLWGIGGVLAAFLGWHLVQRSDLFLLELWGIGMLIIGGAFGVVGLGVLLRIWR